MTSGLPVHAGAMSYSYDAYFSYKHHTESDDWHDRVRRTLQYWVGTELGHEPTFFFDREQVRPGHLPEKRLIEALRASKCLVCFWSPRYFKSKWCQTEWRTFLDRGRRNNVNLVLPASIHDGESFPAEARETLWMDFSKYHQVASPAFFATKKADKFEEKCLKPFARRLAEMIRDAPDHADFPIAEVDERELPSSDPVVKRPADD